MQNEKKRAHNLVLNSRENLQTNAVRKIEYLSPEAILVSTDVGKMAVRGENIHVDNLNSETGELVVKGNINSISYLDKDGESKWLKRIFR